MAMRPKVTPCASFFFFFFYLQLFFDKQCVHPEGVRCAFSLFGLAAKVHPRTIAVTQADRH
jgi:hypothetical protein